MELDDFENEIRVGHPDWTVSKSKSGIATWIDIVMNGKDWFTIEVTPNDGIGVSRRRDEEMHLGGHDEVFEDLVDVMRFLESQT